MEIFCVFREQISQWIGILFQLLPTTSGNWFNVATLIVHVHIYTCIALLLNSGTCSIGLKSVFMTKIYLGIRDLSSLSTRE